MKKHFVGTLLLAMIIFITGCGGGSDKNTTGVVERSNTAPTISGTPVLSVKQGEAFQFTPTSVDADNDDLAFSIRNKPEWMSFDPKSGKLFGTPTKDDVGFYAEIKISVTDGDVSASLDGFGVTVKSTSATLSWTAPTTRTDGTPLAMDEIGGYKVYMGASATDLSLVANVSDPYTMEYEINNLDEGTYYFAVSTYSKSDVESDISVVVSKTI